MMKSIKYLLISLLAVGFVTRSYACVPDCYTPGGYYMYRVCEPKSQSENIDCVNPSSTPNCLEWQKLTSINIPAEDIYQVVYTMSLEEFEAIYDNRDATYDNKFVEWITKRDTAILDFLLLAKTNEHIRFRINSRWYYPSMKVGARMTLEEIAEKALSMKDKRLRDRYLLQAVRALFSLSRYKECVELWEQEAIYLPEDNLMKDLIIDYIAGAMYHVGDSQKSIEYFAQRGDAYSILYCTGRRGERLSSTQALALVCEYAPNSPGIPHELYRIIHTEEQKEENGYDIDENELSMLYELSLEMCENNKVENRAMWYYTAAFLADFMGKESVASRLLRSAENAKSSPYIDESIRLFRIYIDAKTLPYNNEYENRLYSQLKWLDRKIVENIDDEVRTKVVEESKLFTCKSFYYWNDMLRRILLAEVCPRMIRAGRPVRALQLANMADNYLYNIINCMELSYYDYEANKLHRELLTMEQYRYSSCEDNYLDYSNRFFAMIDTLGVDVAKAYLDNVNHSTKAFDKYLNARGYTGSDYLNDIVGTQLLRHMQYGEAIKYLGNVSVAYKNHSNVYMEYEPFEAEPARIYRTKDFKYDFACTMHSLEQSIELTTNPNRKAQLMVKYAMGLRNSFDWCWGLTQYFSGSSFWFVFKDWDCEGNSLKQAALARSRKIIDEALQMVTDDEVAAALQYNMCNFKTVAKKYPDTEYGRLVKGACDNLKDYHAETYYSNE